MQLRLFPKAIKSSDPFSVLIGPVAKPEKHLGAIWIHRISNFPAPSNP